MGWPAPHGEVTMKKIALPVLEETASVAQGWRALRRHRVRAVVTRSGDALWLHEDSDLAEGFVERMGLALRETKRRKIVVLGPQPSEVEIRQFFQRNPREHLVFAAIGHGPAGGLMHFFVRPGDPLAAVEVKAYHCPDDPNEVSTTQKFCNIHNKNYVQDA
jgi:hypothetical protein